jgi:hypothetical protein
VRSVSDEAIERLRVVGFQYTERRRYRGEFRTYTRTQVFPNIAPGILRHMLVVQYGHGNRPNSWRHLRAPDDVARDHVATHALLSSLRLEEHDEYIDPEWARIWSHGAYVYRREYFKGRAGRRYERAVPLSASMAAEHDLYMKRRNAYLAKLNIVSPWLFPSPRDPLQPISEEDA